MKTNFNFKSIKNDRDLENYLDDYCEELGFIVRERDDKRNNNMLWEIMHSMYEDGSWEDVMKDFKSEEFTNLLDDLKLRRSKWAKEWVELFKAVYDFFS